MPFRCEGMRRMPVRNWPGLRPLADNGQNTAYDTFQHAYPIEPSWEAHL